MIRYYNYLSGWPASCSQPDGHSALLCWMSKGLAGALSSRAFFKEIIENEKRMIRYEGIKQILWLLLSFEFGLQYINRGRFFVLDWLSSYYCNLYDILLLFILTFQYCYNLNCVQNNRGLFFLLDWLSLCWFLLLSTWALQITGSTFYMIY